MKITTNSYNLDSYKKYLEILRLSKEYLNKNYLEIDVPLLSSALVPESYLEIFKTEFIYHDEKQNLFLTPSPELFLKRILAYLKINCYSLGKSFRNSESHSDLHSFEFTMLEFYKVNATYMDIADELLKLMKFISLSLSKSEKMEYKGCSIDFSQWEKLTVAEAFQKYAQISEEELLSHELLISKAKEKGYSIENFSYEDIFSQIYTQEIEPNLGVHGFPTLLYDYPKEFAALAKLNKDEKTAQRFEFYIAGIELGDCYTELTDPKEQELRFKDEELRRINEKKTSHPTDLGFIEALNHGLPPCSGIAIGFERLAMIFANTSNIHELKLIEIV